MTVHELKSWPEFFAPVFSGEKPFELRKNDRKYRTGDILVLREWEPNTAKYSGRKIRKKITYVLEGIGSGGIPPLHGLMREYAILGISDEP